MEVAKRVKKELVYKGATVDFYKDYVELPSGKIAEWDFVDHKGAAAILPVTKKGTILLVKQYRNALQRVTLEIPAGGINPGETPFEAAKRELEEETGHKSEHIEHLKDIITAIGFCNECVYIYIADELTPSKQNLDEDEFLDVLEYDVDEVMNMIIDGTIMDAKTCTAVLMYWTSLRR